MPDQSIFRNDLIYRLLYGYVKTCHRLYYKRITISGKPEGGFPVLLAPNHQNGLMDALAVLFTHNKPVAFLARADIFRNKRVAALLNMLKILPVYRIRDGYASLEENDKIFSQTAVVLRSGTPVCIFPEGNHDGHWRLRPLKKGLARIAVREDLRGQVRIQPVGISYDSYFRSRHQILVMYGEPLEITETNPAQVTRRLQAAMKNLMIHLPETGYAVYDTALRNYLKVYPERMDKLIPLSGRLNEPDEPFKQRLEEMNAAFGEADRKKDSLTYLPLQLLLFPFSLAGKIINFIPSVISRKFENKIKDPHLRVSVRFGMFVVLYPVYYLLLIAILSLWLKLIVFLLPLLGITGLFAGRALEQLRERAGFSPRIKALADETMQVLEGK